MKHALLLTLAAVAALAACKPQESAPASAPAASSAAAPATGGNGNWGARQKDYDTFVNSCVAGLPGDLKSESFKNYCACMGDYVMNKYDDAFLRRLDELAARGQTNAPEFTNMQKDLMSNGIKVCPPPTN